MALFNACVFSQKYQSFPDTLQFKGHVFNYTHVVFQPNNRWIGEKFLTTSTKVAQSVEARLISCQKSQPSDYAGFYLLRIDYRMLKRHELSEKEVLTALINKIDKELMKLNLPTALIPCKVKNIPKSVTYFRDKPNRTLEEMGRYAINVTVKDACLKLY